MTGTGSFVLFDTTERALLYPFTYTRSIAKIRVGILTVQERWELLLKKGVQVLSADYLQENYTALPGENAIFINAAIFPDKLLSEQVSRLQYGDVLMHDNIVIAFSAAKSDIQSMADIQSFPGQHLIKYEAPVALIKYPWHLVKLNEKAIAFDVGLLTRGRMRPDISATNKLVAAENIFIEDGATVEHCIINASAGPVYIARDSVVMEGCMLRGPLALGKGATVKMGAAIYGATTIGPECVAGGEIKNSIMMGYSNKAHFGYLGDAVIGEWCNLGAGTSNSNVKNSASGILMEIPGNGTVNAGLKCGLMMGDYSRCAIHTSFNTATFVGIACNIFGEGLTPKHIPGFSWGYTGRYTFDKAIEHIHNWKKFKNQTITERETGILEHLYKQLS